MPLWLLWLIPSYEVGFWSAILLRRKSHNPKRDREILIYGAGGARHHIPIVDERLRKEAGAATKWQARTARWVITSARWIVNSKAFEYGALIAIRKRWPGKKPISSNVRLFS
jgi:hypothetical protein